ncbi:hypothetical protein PX699_19425 [Sphingobium sp. H39-3-25]|uniref:hypothetical protein n=1 Tax=Sphingobium arseniciresistens TaxID=3030834 RepID=UPI0023B8E127|nr:hypothetical protein [Sphingobium arseniciresistens]
MRVLLFALQGVGASGAMADIDFDLRKVPVTTAAPGEIIVTGRRRDQRIAPLPDIPPDTVPRAEMGIAGKLRGGVVVQQQSFGNGTVSNRAMVTLKLPF